METLLDYADGALRRQPGCFLTGILPVPLAWSNLTVSNCVFSVLGKGQKWGLLSQGWMLALASHKACTAWVCQAEPVA